MLKSISTFFYLLTESFVILNALFGSPFFLKGLEIHLVGGPSCGSVCIPLINATSLSLSPSQPRQTVVSFEYFITQDIWESKKKCVSQTSSFFGVGIIKIPQWGFYVLAASFILLLCVVDTLWMSNSSRWRQLGIANWMKIRQYWLLNFTITSVSWIFRIEMRLLQYKPFTL